MFLEKFNTMFDYEKTQISIYTHEQNIIKQIPVQEMNKGQIIHNKNSNDIIGFMFIRGILCVLEYY